MYQVHSTVSRQRTPVSAFHVGSFHFLINRLNKTDESGTAVMVNKDRQKGENSDGQKKRRLQQILSPLQTRGISRTQKKS